MRLLEVSDVHLRGLADGLSLWGSSCLETLKVSLSTDVLPSRREFPLVFLPHEALLEAFLRED